MVEDVVLALINSNDPKQYIQRIKLRDPELKKGWVQIVQTLPIDTLGGKQKMVCATAEGLFRIIQSIPSPKAEPFKRWLAKVGYERVQEIDDPELGMKRTRALYHAKGYSSDWIENRMRGIVIREELTDEWEKRGASSQNDYAILTAEISKAAFGVTPSRYKKIKGLKRQNLRDHMNDFELIFNMLGERFLKGKKSEILLSPEQVFKELKDLRNHKKEHFVIFYLDSRNQEIASEIISVGSINANLVHPREVFEPAVKNLAAQIIFAHNHPSGDPEPSEEDLKMTKQLIEAGKILGIEVIDHIIIADKSYISFKDKKLI